MEAGEIHIAIFSRQIALETVEVCYFVNSSECPLSFFKHNGVFFCFAAMCLDSTGSS